MTLTLLIKGGTVLLTKCGKVHNVGALSVRPYLKGFLLETSLFEIIIFSYELFVFGSDKNLQEIIEITDWFFLGPLRW